MQQIKCYNYPIRVIAQIINDDSIVTEWRQVYSRKITTFQGVDNPIKISFLNTDQKSANIANLTIAVNVFTADSQDQWFSKTANISNAALGLGTVTFASSDLAPLELGFYEIGVTATDSTGSITPVYLNDNYQGRLPMELKPGPVSSLTDPITITFTDTPMVGVVSNYINLTTRPTGDSTATFSANLIVPYTGNIIAQGTMVTNPVNSDFGNITIQNYSNFAGQTMFNVLGSYATIRFLVDALDPTGNNTVNANSFINSAQLRY